MCLSEGKDSQVKLSLDAIKLIGGQTERRYQPQIIFVYTNCVYKKKGPR